MKTAFLNMRQCASNFPNKENFTIIGNNTGNCVFCNALQNIYECDSIFPGELDKAENYDNFITAAFIWIKENEDKSTFNQTIKALNDKPIIPISIGLQADSYKSDFKLHPNTVRLFKEMQERCVLAVRGEYTADILDKHGIKNTAIVGCPSLYTELNPNKKIEKKPLDKLGSRIACNYRTLCAELGRRDYEILSYLNSYSSIFIEQTVNYLSQEILNTIPKEVLWLITHKKRIFFIFKDWINLMKTFEFSIGARFHGNTVALLAGIPSLYLTFDSRTKEMTDYFKLPTLNIESFDVTKPITYYYDKADYTEFNKNYPKIFKNFEEFSQKNNLTLRKNKEQL